jgi:penicillin amidase
LFIKHQLETNGPYCRSAKITSCQQFLSESLSTAVKKLSDDQGTRHSHWGWGKVHRMTFNELALGQVEWIGWIWNRSIPTPGDDYTVNVGSYELSNLQQHEGPSYRQIIDLADFNKSLFIQTLGQSDNPFDKHHGDLMQRWRDGQYLPMSSDPKDWGKIQKMVLKAG